MRFVTPPIALAELLPLLEATITLSLASCCDYYCDYWVADVADCDDYDDNWFG